MGDYFKYALYGASLLTQLLVLCWHGEKIIQLVSLKEYGILDVIAL